MNANALDRTHVGIEVSVGHPIQINPLGSEAWIALLYPEIFEVSELPILVEGQDGQVVEAELVQPVAFR